MCKELLFRLFYRHVACSDLYSLLDTVFHSSLLSTGHPPEPRLLHFCDVACLHQCRSRSDNLYCAQQEYQDHSAIAVSFTLQDDCVLGSSSSFLVSSIVTVIDCVNSITSPSQDYLPLSKIKGDKGGNLSWLSSLEYDFLIPEDTKEYLASYRPCMKANQTLSKREKRNPLNER